MIFEKINLIRAFYPKFLLKLIRCLPFLLLFKKAKKCRKEKKNSVIILFFSGGGGVLRNV